MGIVKDLYDIVVGPCVALVKRRWPGKEAWTADSNIPRLLSPNEYQKENRPDLAWKRSSDARWSTWGYQVKDSYFRLDLGRKGRVTTVRFQHGVYQDDYPSTWVMEAWEEDEKNAIKKQGAGPIIANLGGRTVRYIKVTALANPERPNHWWSISDVEIKERRILPWPELTI